MGLLFRFVFFMFFFALLTGGCGIFRPRLHSGDLIFQDLDCPLCEAIENATEGYRGKPVSHMGIVYRRGDSLYVLEAYDKVRLTPWDTFIRRSPKIMIGRLKRPYRKYISEALRRGLNLRGKPYDDEFRLHNGKYYCSELVYEVFRDEEGKPLFFLEPMNFNNLKTGRPDSAWIEYFKTLHKKIPQGEPGCNPASYSRSSLLKILYSTY